MVTLVDPVSKIIVKSSFTKLFSNNDYEVYFNSKTGLEVLKGINGKPDPFYTELPLLLDIGIMGSCDNKCIFCYQGDYEEPDMTLENFKIIIDQVKHHVNQVALGGRGDPNKHEHFEEIITYARKNDIVPNYTTSSFKLTDREIEISKMCGAVAVSDYGNSVQYDAIQRFIDAGIKTNIHLMFNKETYQKCLLILYGHNPWLTNTQQNRMPLFDHTKLNAVIFLLFKPQGRGVNHTELIPTPYQLKVISEKITNSKSIFKIGMDSCLSNHVFKYGELTGIDKVTLDTCEGSRMSAYISPSMNMMACSYADPNKYAVPITKNKDISYIWNRSNPFRSFRTVLKKKPNTCPAGF